MIKKILTAFALIATLSGSAIAAEPTKVEAPKTTEDKTIVSVGFPNQTGITFEGQDTIRYYDIKQSGKFDINWDVVCKITAKPFNPTVLQSKDMNTNTFYLYTLPFLIKEANQGQHKC